ncbi:MAG: tetratricopeptide repeat protein [Treponema sp.]|nr:tetratricopeptide repeat protein [Treponema sp.]
MSDKNETVTLETTLSNMLVKSRKVVTGIVIAAVVVIIGIIIGITVHAKAVESGIEQVDTIYYVLTKDVSDLDDAGVAARYDEASAKLEPLAKKSGVVGLRASMLLAEINFGKGDFEKAMNLWISAANAKKNAYTSYYSFYNASVCAENLNDAEKAVSYMNKACESDDFVLIDKALFNLGRLNESKNDFAAAKAAYERVNDIHPDSNWAKLSKSRLIALKSSGKIQ